MDRYLKLPLLLLVTLGFIGCPPTTGPGPNPPDLSWVVRDSSRNQNQNFGQNGAVHVTGDTYTLSFIAQAPGGLTSMNLTAQGNVSCAADNGSGGIFTIGFRQITLPPQSTTFSPTVTSNSLLISPFNFYQLDCHAVAQTDHGPKEAYATNGTITLTGTAIDTSNRTSTGQLQVQLP